MEGMKVFEAYGSVLTLARSVNLQVIRSIPIRQISFASDDPQDDHILGIISSDPKSGTQVCFVLRCKRPVSLICIYLCVWTELLFIVCREPARKRNRGRDRGCIFALVFLT